MYCHQHCQKAASSRMSGLKLLEIVFSTISKRNSNPLFNADVQPHIEYCSQAVGPYMKHNFTALEKVQWRATKLVQGMENLPYQELPQEATVKHLNSA